jgi:hypothetical protein
MSVGAQNDWLFLPVPSPFRPSAFAPEEQGSLDERKTRVVATFGGRVYRARRRFDLSSRDQFTCGAAGDLLIFKYVSVSGESVTDRS